MRPIEINSPERAVSTLAATKLFIDCFLFISQTTEGTDYRAIVSAGRCHFSRRRRPFGRPASVVLREKREDLAIIMPSTFSQGDSVYDRYRLRYTRIHISI